MNDWTSSRCDNEVEPGKQKDCLSRARRRKARSCHGSIRRKGIVTLAGGIGWHVVTQDLGHGRSTSIGEEDLDHVNIHHSDLVHLQAELLQKELILIRVNLHPW